MMIIVLSAVENGDALRFDVVEIGDRPLKLPQPRVMQCRASAGRPAGTFCSARSRPIISPSSFSQP